MSIQPTESELKPCPWCKAKNIAKSHRSNQAICMGCGAVGPVGITPQRVIELWNTRPAETELQSLRSEVERLREERDQAMKLHAGLTARGYHNLGELSRGIAQAESERDALKSQNAELVKALEGCERIFSIFGFPETAAWIRATLAKTGGAK